jgi:hypothetical protein
MKSDKVSRIDIDQKQELALSQSPFQQAPCIFELRRNGHQNVKMRSAIQKP